MPLTGQDLEKYDRLRGRYEEMANRLLEDIEPKDMKKREQRQKVRSAAASFVSPAEARRRTGDPEKLKSIQARMREKVDIRDQRVSGLKGNLSSVQMTERQLHRRDREFKSEVKKRQLVDEGNEKDMVRHAKQLDDEMRKADRELIRDQSRLVHEQEQARKEKLQLLAERRMRQNQAIKQGHKEEHELNFRHTKLMQQMEKAARDAARQERDYEDRWRRLEAEKARLKQEARETKLALEMKAKMKRRQSDEWQMEQERLRRDAKKKLLSKEEREQELAAAHGHTSRTNDRRIQNVGMQRQMSKERSKTLSTRENVTKNELRAQTDYMAEARRALEGNVEFEEQKTLLGLADDKDEYAINKAKLIELEEKFDTFCGTVREKQAWEKSIAQQVIEMKKKVHTDATKHAKRDLQKSSDTYTHSLSETKRAAETAAKQARLVDSLEADLSRMRAENENKARLMRLKQRQEEEKMEQQLIREHSELTKAMCRKAGNETMMGVAAARLAEDALTVQLEEEEIKKLSRVQPLV